MALETDPARLAGEHFDVVIVGTGFGSAFFLHRLLRENGGRILVLEWGQRHDHQWQMENEANSALPHQDTYRSQNPKPWNYTIGFGGGTNCWFAQTPRFHPSDFRLKSLYGVGADWPISYDDLEPYYGQAESIMSVSGDPDMAAVMPRSTPFPQPAHHPTTPDRAMKAARPSEHFIMPTARARVAANGRGACCASLRCQLCPADAKFTINNGMTDIFDDPRVTLVLGAQVRTLEADASSVSSAVFDLDGKDVAVTGDLFVLGANAIQSPAILKRSAMDGPLVGRGLHESYGTYVEAMLDGMDNFDGSTITTGLNFGLYDGAFRSDYGAALVYFENRWTHGLRAERGRHRQILPMMIVTEELVNDDDRVEIDEDGVARVHYGGPSSYTKKGQSEALAKLPKLLEPLPVEDIQFRRERPTESHLQGTLRMGADPASSVIDADMIHHRYRNLVVVGSSTFTTCSCANPSLTVAALSMRAADRLASRSRA
ncbi:GMC family oxidoreductase [Caulobacter segnis]|uniref:GMC oxidoreductase n=1 Tax=Caulobacter segnis TaxID=88688 RepID=UPI00240F3756|nr:GMC family oxidoreductase [Caulobacter segnis]MDG2520294.1 GMC family oxidoreductase [Caulobacter segnis]